jgi:hypothetical protein
MRAALSGEYNWQVPEFSRIKGPQYYCRAFILASKGRPRFLTASIDAPGRLWSLRGCAATYSKLLIACIMCSRSWRSSASI